jgi:hypothetical protein
MGVNQNFSMELDLYPEIDLTSLSSNSAKTIEKLSAIGIRLVTAAEIQIDDGQNTCKTTTAKK